LPEFINPNNYVVHLTGPNGETVQVRARHKVVLAEYFERYVARGFIRLTSPQDNTEIQAKPIQARIQINRSVTQKRIIPPPVPPISTAERQQKRNDDVKIRRAAAAARVANRKIIPNPPLVKNLSPRQIVGHALNTDPNELLKNNIAKNQYPISNNIGVGILSYNRGHCLKRLIDSIIKTTDLRQTTIFISDDASDDPTTIRYLEEISQNSNLTILRNNIRLGVAGNSNRLLRCLSRFAYGLLLNDDIEIISQGWEHLYPEIMNKTGFHHLIYRQPGIYRADEGEAVSKNNVSLLKVIEKPHGAVLAFTNKMLETVGGFDESYGLYGMEHIDWSQRAWELGLQEAGFYDVKGSSQFFVLHNDTSAVADRGKHLHAARQIFNSRTPRKIEFSEASKVPDVTYIVPFRNFERSDSIKSVINNIRAQRFPVINIIMVEQDSETHIDLVPYYPVKYLLAQEKNNLLFNKSKAFNLAASQTKTDCVILHDADMLSQGHYTTAVMGVLKDYEACHLGSTVIYTSKEAMEYINKSGVVDTDAHCERVVGYYEGGSIACRLKTFWKVGAFNEDYWGYGVEDCDFYARLSQGSNWSENRAFDFLHLWHSRVPGWNIHHEQNKRIEVSLKTKTIEHRIQLQHAQLDGLGYASQVVESLK
jgi:GT2 family glycosyltransferase